MNVSSHADTMSSLSTITNPVSRPWSPHAYQLKAISHLLQRGAAGLFLKPGLGKTSSSLAALTMLKKEGKARKVLVIAPLRVAQIVWPGELKKWTDFHHFSHVVLHGDDKDYLLQKDVDLYVINYDGLKWFEEAGGFDLHEWDALILDESTRVKNYSTKRFKILKRHLNKFKWRWILTGTPAPNGYEDLWAQTYCMDGGLSLGRFITHYRMQYFIPPRMGGYDWSLRQGADLEIQERLAPYVLTMLAEDYLEMPELVPNYIVVDLPPEARRHYTEMEDNFITELKDGAVLTAPNAAASGARCRQIINGAVYTEPPEYEVLHDAKLDALEELVEDLNGNPLLVFYEFRHDLYRILKLFPKAKYLGPGVSADQTQKIITGFNAGQVPLLLAHPQSAGHGLNLQDAANNICWFGLTWNLEDYEQAIARVYRQGNPNSHVYVHHIIARDTLDERVVRVLERKDREQGALLRAFKE